MRFHSSQFSCAAGRSLLFLAFWGAQGCDIFPPVSLCCSQCRHQPLCSMGLRQHELLVTDAQSKTITHLQETAQGRTAPEVSWGEGTTSANSTAGPAAHAASVHRAGTEWFGGLCKTALLPRFPVSYTKQIPQIQHILTVLAKMAQTRINILSVTVPFYFFFCIFFLSFYWALLIAVWTCGGVSTLQLWMGTHISLVHHLITSSIARVINSVCKGWGKHRTMDPVHYCHDTSLDFWQISLSFWNTAKHWYLVLFFWIVSVHLPLQVHIGEMQKTLGSLAYLLGSTSRKRKVFKFTCKFFHTSTVWHYAIELPSLALLKPSLILGTRFSHPNSC